MVQLGSGANQLYPDGDSRFESAVSFSIVESPGATPAPLVGNPFHGMPIAVPGIIEAEGFDFGGEGVAYNDRNNGNIGSKYRTLDNVDIEATADTEGDYNVGWIETGEWLEYTIEVPSGSNQYVLTTRVATENSGGSFIVQFDGINKTGIVAIPNTSGWQS